MNHADDKAVKLFPPRVWVFNRASPSMNGQARAYYSHSIVGDEEYLSTYEHICLVAKAIGPYEDDLAALEAKLEVYRKALEFYANRDNWSCRLRDKFEEPMKWYEEAKEYYQDPYDLLVMKDMGTRANEALVEASGAEGK